MRSWKTTVAGVLPAMIVLMTCYVEQRWPTADETAVIAGLFGIGVAAKDYNVTGAP